MSKNNNIDSTGVKIAEAKLSTENEKLSLCVGSCTASDTTHSTKAVAGRELLNIHDTMIKAVSGVKNDTTLNADAVALTQDDIIIEATAKFDKRVEQVLEAIAMGLNEAEKNLFTNNISLSTSDVALMGNATILEEMRNDTLAYQTNVANANILGHLNSRGLLKSDISTNLNRLHSPDAYETIQNLNDDKKEIVSISRAEKRIVSTIRPNPLRMEKIRANIYKGRISK